VPGIPHRGEHEDTAAVGAFFDEQWRVYQTFLREDYLEHRLFYALLHAVLLTRFDGPVSLLELGCGDASQTVRALTQVPLRRYVGIDLAAAALSLAKTNVQAVCANAELRQNDLLRGLTGLRETFDVVLASYALHHLSLDEKRDALAHIDRTLAPHGVFVLIDVVRRADETRDAYLDRCLGHYRTTCRVFTPRQLDLIASHVRAADFPESEETLRELAAAAGFARVARLAGGVADLAACLGFFR
jgi:ubiquinone/menaquinone biosynthesis C-methylase UbiE